MRSLVFHPVRPTCWDMIAFANLLERLVFTPSRNAKIALLRRYFTTQPDPDRGIALAAITGELSFTAAKPGLIRELAAARTDPVLFDWSYDYVGDLAETVALIWPAKQADSSPPSLAEVVETLETAPKSALPGLVAEWLDCADALHPAGATETDHRRAAGRRVRPAGEDRPGGDRWSRRRRGRGGLARPRTAVSAAVRLAGGQRPEARPSRCAGVPPADAGAPAGSRRPRRLAAGRLACGVEMGRHSRAAGRHRGPAGGCIRGAPTTSPARFPRSSGRWDFQAVLDGELLVLRDGVVAPFADLQQRLNRKSVTGKIMERFPVGCAAV